MNRVGRVRDNIFWMHIFQHLEMEKSSTGKETYKVPPYTPGLLLIRLPEAGPVWGAIDFSFWAAFLYIIGSVIYVISAVFLWSSLGLDYEIGVATNLIAGIVFVINAAVCMIDWWLQVQQMSFMNMDLDGLEFSLTQNSEKSMNYYCINNLFFMGAAVMYVIQGLWMQWASTDLTGCSALL